ncbi:hypothetical protein FH972_011168 [Carpinus fangiana]|uniref:Uncharacterized protein n=1 Tax=Carpinus fangiana TaxID=176857 RepID=A0A660KQH9_9ROSI|nr:hypothetical protein FH972_011168 [Carpinus fangiana]
MGCLSKMSSRSSKLCFWMRRSCRLDDFSTESPRREIMDGCGGGDFNTQSMRKSQLASNDDSASELSATTAFPLVEGPR